jgi:alpha-glucosidase (family GH31 glycosyl hydrolase)
MRALWLHYPAHPVAVARGDEYLWGRDRWVAPEVEKAATLRQSYFPHGAWYDFWTGEPQEGGREITRPVDLAIMPLYVRARSILPFGPVKQYSGERVDEPLTLVIYPGADGSSLLYEDDGASFDYRKGEWMGLRMAWNDGHRALTLRLGNGSRMLAPFDRDLIIKIGATTRPATVKGRPLEVRF